MTETKNSKMLDEGGKSVVALMAALMAAIFAFQLNASMLSPALTTMRVELNTTRCADWLDPDGVLYLVRSVLAVPAATRRFDRS